MDTRTKGRFYTRTRSGSRADRGTRFGLCGGGTSKSFFPNGRKGKSSSNWWTDGYIQVQNYLYGSDSTLQDFEKGISEVPFQEAELGNGFAMHDLGRMFADGLGRDADVGLHRNGMRKH